ncbi:AI-2E family transporter [Wansuia hejianensis]|uniref:AI-2E family transporter n=1 Tax=Wansuia hejianensis TaxID=2763667 RepID=A0A926F0Q9_9FIRM|nr:AI-2E family transporter [Wansuia hejianensis]MBC8589765.1 AI-2E family transporter [Wansuia hejianensis]
MNLKSKQMKNSLFLISFAIILMWILDNISYTWNILGKLLKIISPFIIGFAIAFIFNGPMNFIEKKVFGDKWKFKKVKRKYKRTISYLLTLILFITTIFTILFIVVPELVNTVQDLGNKIPAYVDRVELFAEENLKSNPEIGQWIKNVDWENMETKLIEFLKNSALDWAGATFTFASSVLSGIINILLAFVFSVYILLQKEELIRQTKKFVLAYFPKKAYHKIFYIAKLSNRAFSNFLSGQLFEAFIIGILFFITMLIFRFPYALMISLIIFITALIPIVGAFIGCIVGVFLIMVVDFKMSLWFLLLFIIIQQLEGNLIYPHIVGKASGLPSIWIFVAVTLGGSMMGILGIILFIPIFSVIYTLLKESINNRLRLKEIRDIK